jgi:hypothetical protein
MSVSPTPACWKAALRLGPPILKRQPNCDHMRRCAPVLLKCLTLSCGNDRQGASGTSYHLRHLDNYSFADVEASERPIDRWLTGAGPMIPGRPPAPDGLAWFVSAAEHKPSPNAVHGLAGTILLRDRQRLISGSNRSMVHHRPADGAGAPNALVPPEMRVLAKVWISARRLR